MVYNQTLQILTAIKANKPLVLNITNNVTMDLIANGLLSLGASPIMTMAAQELEDLLRISSVLVINLGTLNPAFMELCERACKLANQLNKPIILDPVGAGASKYRTQMGRQLIDRYSFSVIRGNASEIMALSGLAQVVTKGVDSTAESYTAIDSACALSKNYRSVVVVSGKMDLIVDVKSDRKITFERGSHWMPMMTGSGCLLSAVTAAFCAVHLDPYEASHSAALFYSVCGEIAGKKSQGPGSFRTQFIDALSVVHPQSDF